MKRLFFLRHGLADYSAFAGDNDDLRPLTRNGRDRIVLSAGTISGLKPGIDLILTSPLTRALETAEIMATGLGLQDKMQIDQRLGFGFRLDDVAAIIGDWPDRKRIMLVGHEPSFSRVVGDLTGGSDIIFKKGGLARIDIRDEILPRGELVWLLPPKALVHCAARN